MTLSVEPKDLRKISFSEGFIRSKNVSNYSNQAMNSSDCAITKLGASQETGECVGHQRMCGEKDCKSHKSPLITVLAVILISAFFRLHF